MIGKLVLGTTKDSSIPVILKETGPELYIEKAIINNSLRSGGTSVINIPSNVTSISDGALCYAYYNAGTSLVDEIPNFHNITELYGNSLHYTFYGCTRLYGNVDFSSLINIYGNSSLDGAFMNCYSLTGTVNISSLATISQQYSFRSTFSGCSNITGINLESLTTISGAYACQYMFSGCTNLTDIDLSSLTTISGNYACQQMFYNCTSLDDVDLSSLTTVSGSYACNGMFYGCQNLKNVDLSGLINLSLSPYSFYQMFTNCTSLENINLSNLTTITYASSSTEQCSYMFSGCQSLQHMDLSSLRSLDGISCNAMFRNCVNLKDIDLSNLVCANYSNGLQSMFSGCTSLETVTISKLMGTSGNSIFYNIFDNCQNLTKNPFTNLTQIYLSGYIFSGSGIVDGTFPKLAYINGSDNAYQFYNCHDLEKLDFPALARMYGQNIFRQGFIYGCDNANFTKISFPMASSKYLTKSSTAFGTNCFSTNDESHKIDVHFRKDMQSIIEAISGYATCWGANAILFDLIGTITVNGNTYRREGSCNKPGYIAWKKLGSTITASDGNDYTYDTDSIGYWTKNTGTSLFDYPGAMYYWLKVGATSTSDTTSIRTANLDPQVGDPAFVYSTDYSEPTLTITANNLEFIYTVDTAEPEVGDTAYSDVSGAALGTISAVA